LSKEKMKKMKKRIAYTRIDNRIFNYMPIITTNGFAVYATLKKHENRHTGRCYPSYNTVAEITGLDRKTVIKYTNLLVILGFITKQAQFIDGRQTSNQYSFRTPGGGTLTPPQDRVESPDSPGGGVPPQPLSIEPALTKKQMECPHKDIARPVDGVAYCRKCFVDLETLQGEVTPELTCVDSQRE
jgi:hypothetical protein